MLPADLGAGGDPLSFEGRNRRPPRGPVNCLLSFVYALLVKDFVAVCLGVGLDPYLGVFHRPRFGRPALALNLAEEFRPLVGDSTVVNLINNGEIRASDFVVRAQGVALTSGRSRGGHRGLRTSPRRRGDAPRVRVPHHLPPRPRCAGPHPRRLMLGEIPEYTPFSIR